MSSIIQEFVDFAMEKYGLEFCPQKVMKSRDVVVRHHLKGDRKGTLNGWTKLAQDKWLINFGDNKHYGTHYTWNYEGDNEGKSKKQIEEERRRNAEEARKNRERERELQLKRSEDALEIYNNCVESEFDSFGYVVKKQLPDYPYGAIYTDWRYVKDKFFRSPQNRHGRVMIIPITCEDGYLNSLQLILPEKEKLPGGGFKSDKWFMPGCAKGMLIVPGKEKFVFVVEGYATGITVNELTGCKVYIGFDTSGLEPAVNAAFKQNPDSIIVIASDNDIKTVDKKEAENGFRDERWNAGQRTAKAIINKINSTSIKKRLHNMPAITPEWWNGDYITDWNDLVSMGVMSKKDVRSIIADFCKKLIS